MPENWEVARDEAQGKQVIKCPGHTCLCPVITQWLWTCAEPCSTIGCGPEPCSIIGCGPEVSLAQASSQFLNPDTAPQVVIIPALSVVRRGRHSEIQDLTADE